MRAWVSLFFGIFCIGCSAIFVKLAQTSAISISFYRMVFASVGAIVILFFTRKKVFEKVENRQFFPLFLWKKYKFGIFAGIFWGINLGLWSNAVAISNATIATLLINLAPIWTGLFSHYIIKEKLGNRFWFGLSVAIFGVVVTFWPMLRGHSVDFGTVLGLFGSFLYAFYQIFTKKSRDADVTPIEILLVTSLVAGIVLAIAGVFFDAPMLGFSTKQWLIMAAAGIVSSVIGWSLVMFSMGKLPVTTTSLALLMQAVFTAILDYLIFNEKLEPRLFVGGMIILGGLILVVRKKQNNIG
jgi:drug/metabolite transporter (DMT)-like permease